MPVSAYEVFEALAENQVVDVRDLEKRIAVVGLRNKIVHDYMNLDPAKIFGIIENKEYELVTRFLLTPIPQ